MGNNELDQLRDRVDELNLELLRLINERARLVQEIGQVKEVKAFSASIQSVKE
jgi:3-deoxy-7-phosphoheptulonate synthase/chorismate mutase